MIPRVQIAETMRMRVPRGRDEVMMICNLGVLDPDLKIGGVIIVVIVKQENDVLPYSL